MSEYFESIRKGAKEALAWKQGKDTGARVRQYTALDVTEIRKKTKMTQEEFSQYFQIPLSTLRQWEQGKRLPQGPAQALLKIIAYDSDTAIEALHKYSIL